MVDRIAFLNSLIGKPYRLGAQGPDAYDCYSATRAVQSGVFGRDMPPFEIPGTAGRWAIAAAITIHPERNRWIEAEKPVDGAAVTMARNEVGYHIGTYLETDGGIIVHALERVGVVAGRLIELEAEGWRKFRFHIPNE